MKKLIFSCLSLIVCITIIFGSSAVNCYNVSAETPTTAKNIILFIGDGMGPVHVEMAHKNNKNTDLTMETLPYSAMSITNNSKGTTTDSAAGATAIACGERTLNGYVGVGPKGNSQKLQNIREFMASRGSKTGIITTSYIADATPACFGAHIDSRENKKEITQQLITSNIDVLMGGGIGLSDENECDNVVNTAKTTNGYTVLWNKNSMAQVSSGKILGLFASSLSSSFPYYDNYKSDTPTLAEMTKKAIDILSENDSSFFLVVEGAKIDHAATDGSVSKTIKEVLELDKAVKVAWDFAQKDNNTLVVVTADHETGGLEENGVSYQFTTTSHTSANVPIYAGGVGAERFTGEMVNTGIYKRMIKALDNSYEIVDDAPIVKETKNTQSTESTESTTGSEFDKYVDGSAYKNQETDDKSSSSETASKEEEVEETKKASNDEEGKEYYSSSYKTKKLIKKIVIIAVPVFVVLLGIEAFFIIRMIKKRKSNVVNDNGILEETNAEDTTGEENDVDK